MPQQYLLSTMPCRSTALSPHPQHHYALDSHTPVQMISSRQHLHPNVCMANILPHVRTCTKSTSKPVSSAPNFLRTY